MSTEILAEFTAAGPALTAELDTLRYLVFEGMKGETGAQGPKGDAGQNGQNGQNGADGVSPTVTVAEIAGGHRVTVTDRAHPLGQTFDVMDGADGGGGAASGAALCLQYDGMFDDGDPGNANLMLISNIPNLDTANAIREALIGGDIGSAVFADVTESTSHRDYALYAVGYANGTATVVFARDEGSQIRTVSISGGTKTSPVFGTIPSPGVSTPRIPMTAADTAPTIEPNRLYVFPEMASLSPVFAAASDAGAAAEYHFLFASGASPTTLTLPAAIRQPDGFTVDSYHVYEISIAENCMTAQGWEES